MLTCEVPGIRTNCVTGEKTHVTVTFATYDGLLDVHHGGVTGHERWKLEDFLWNFDRPFVVCMGTDKRWDRLEIPGPVMRTVWLNLVKNVEGDDDVQEPAPEHVKRCPR